MGRYDFAAQRVGTYAAQILQHKPRAPPPPWYFAVTTVPPAERLTRPPMQRSQRSGKKASRLFKPVRLQYEEDRLRWEYFNDHPWELARPRIVLEDDGRDLEKWDWSVPLDHALHRPTAGERNDEGVRMDELWDETMKTQASRPINGEAVVRRQQYLMSAGLQREEAYDVARKEYYRFRHAKDIERRVAREEALSTGAFFGPGPLEIGMRLEDKQYAAWKQWAEENILMKRQARMSAYSGQDTDGLDTQELDQEEFQEVPESVPASSRGQEVRGGSAGRP